MYHVPGVMKFTASFPTHRNWDGRQTCQRKKGTGKCQMPRKLMSKEGGGRWKGTGPMEQVKRLRACLHSDAISPSLWIPQHFAWACPDLGCCPLILTAAVRASVLHSPHWCAHLNQALLPATPPMMTTWNAGFSVMCFFYSEQDLLPGLRTAGSDQGLNSILCFTAWLLVGTSI